MKSNQNLFLEHSFRTSLLGLLLFSFASFSSAQINVNAKLDTNILLIGDQVRFTLEVQHPININVRFPVLPDTISKLEILSRSKIDSVKSAQPPALIEKQTFILTGFDSGYFVIPPVQFTYSQNNDTSPLFAETEPILVTVNTLSVDTMQSIKDIKAPLDVPFSLKEAIPYILGGLVVAVLIAALIYYFKNRKKPVPLSKKIPTRPAHEIAIEELEKLESEKLWQQGHVKTYHSRLSDIVRTYIEHRFGINAMEQTTDEIMDNFLADMIAAELKSKLKNTLELADLAKFAKVQPLPDENQRSLDFAFFFVRETQFENMIAETKSEDENILNQNSNASEKNNIQL